MNQSNDFALQALIKLEKEARAFGFDWPNEGCIIEQAVSECAEIQEAFDQQESSERIQEEIGDLLHTAISLCVFSGFSVEDTLMKIVRKFGSRLKSVQQLTHQQGLEHLRGQSFEFMLELWKKAKEEHYASEKPN